MVNVSKKKYRHQENNPQTANSRKGNSMNNKNTRRLLASLALAFLPLTAVSQSGDDAWYGLPLPPDFEAHTLPAIIGTRGPAPAVVPEGESGFTELAGERLYQDLETIVDFSRQS